MCGFCVNLSIYFCLVKLYHGLTSIEYSLDKLIGPPHNFFFNGYFTSFNKFN